MFPECQCRTCQDNRVLVLVDECGGYFEARKQMLLESAVYKARLKDLSSADPMARELSKSFFGQDYIRKAAIATGS